MQARITLAPPAEAGAGRGMMGKRPIVDLGTLGGDESHATAINTGGQIAGTATNANGHCRPYRWAGGALHDLGVLPGGSNGIGSGIGPAGQVVGWCHDDRYGDRATLWRDDAALALGAPGRGESRAAAINAAGIIVGSARAARGDWRAIRWHDDGQAADLGTLGGSSSHACALNDAGLIVGAARDPGGLVRAVLWRDGQLVPLATGAGGESRARGINAAGQIVGSIASAAGSRRACLWNALRATTLGTLPAHSGSEATAINAAGQVVGVSWDSLGNRRAFVWTTGQPTDLNDFLPGDSGWILEHANGISDGGRIVGWGRYRGWPRAFLLDLPPERPGTGTLRARDLRRA